LHSTVLLYGYTTVCSCVNRQEIDIELFPVSGHYKAAAVNIHVQVLYVHCFNFSWIIS
jgi:hypothetical protein